jgi:hypothetical protein
MAGGSVMSIWQTPAVVLVLLTWLASPATTLSEVARRETIRRQLAAPAGRVYTNEDLPVFTVTEPPQAAAATASQDPDKPPAAKPGEPPPPAAAQPDAKHDEAWWRDRITAARKAVTTDQLLADAMQSRINGLTADWINRDDPAQKAQLFEQRQQAIAEQDRLKKQLEADRKAIQDVLDDAKKNDVPAGWIR